MRRWLSVALVGLAGCGRLSFDASRATDGGTTGDAIDGDAGPSVLRYSYVKPMNTETFDQFGWFVAVSADGSTIAVGAPAEDGGVPGINASDGSGNQVLDAGAVYVFVRTGTTWAQQAYVKPSVVNTGDRFGEMLALSSDGNTLAVGVPSADTAVPDAGAVYVFTRSSATWSEQMRITEATPVAGDQLGFSVALSSTGDYLAAGATSENTTVADSGAAYVFVRSGTVWSQQAFLKAWNAGSLDNFGFSVALSGDGSTLAVSAASEDNSLAGVHAGPGPFADDNALGEAGAAYVFTRAGTAWSQQAYIKPSNVGFGGDFFGHPLTLDASGNVLGCAAPGADTQVANSGSVWMFRRTGSTWVEQQELKASNAGDNDQFGASVALAADGTQILVGGLFEDSNATGIDGNQADDSLLESGAAYLFELPLGATAWSQHSYIKSRSPGAGDQFSDSLGISADHRTQAIASYNEDSAATGIDGNAADESAQDSGAIEISFY